MPLEAIRQDEKRLHRLRENGDKFSTDPAFLEKVARDEGMARTNEMIFRCVDDRPVASNAVTYWMIGQKSAEVIVVASEQ